MRGGGSHPHIVSLASTADVQSSQAKFHCTHHRVGHTQAWMWGRSLQEEWCHQGYTTPVKQLGLGKERTIKTINVYHIPSTNSIRWWEMLLIQTHVHYIRTCCKRQQDRDLCSILSPTRAVEYLLMVHETESGARRVFCTFLLQDITAFLTWSSSPTLLWQERQDCVTTSQLLMGHVWGMAAGVRQGHNTQTAASHPNDPLDCNALVLSRTRNGFHSQWAVACFSLAN